MRKDQFSIGIDVGGTNIKAGLVDEAGRIIRRKFIQTAAQKGLRAVIRNLSKIISEWINNFLIKEIGIGIAGLIDHKKGLVRFSPNLPGFRNVPLKKILENEFKIKTYVGNDANAVALGEYYFGCGKNKKNLFVVTLGTGIGSGIIIDGKLVLGSNFQAGELGHITIVPKGWKCSCGKRGCLEAFIGTRGILRIANLELKGKMSKIWALTKNDKEKITPKIINQAAKEGDKVALAIIKKIGYYLGIGLGQVVSLLDPEIIVLGGQVAKMGRTLIQATKPVLKAQLMTNKLPLIRISKLGSDAGILGATKFAEILN